MTKSIDYQQAGVDIDKGARIVDKIKASVSRTHSNAVLAPLGGFAGLYDLSEICHNYQAPVMVQSIDGVGTKSIVARMSQDYRHLGEDLVSATVNDILVCGAKPLTLLDYVASDKLNEQAVVTLIESIARSCQRHNISLVGGETAEMPDTYQYQEIDLVGVVTGVVEKSQIIDGSKVQAGDVILGIGSSGLHTNGYSLAREVLFNHKKLEVDCYVTDLGMTLVEALLTPHVNYQPHVEALKHGDINLHAMAHITGGGLMANFERVVPEGVSIHFDRAGLPIPTIFSYIQQCGAIADNEMARAFNLGVGYCVVVPSEQADEALKTLQAMSKQPVAIIGEIQCK